jgi:flagellar biosynthetic protein FlhB
MAEEGQDRTEPASPRKREEARKQGQVAFSPDLAGSVILMAGIVAIVYLGPDMAEGFFDLVRTQLREPMPRELSLEAAQEMLGRFFVQFARLVGPILALLLVVSIANSLVQVGFQITPERLEFNFEKLSPASGLSKLFSLAALVKGLFAIVKVLALAALVFLVIRSRIGVFGSLGQGDVGGAAALSWALMLRLALYLGGAFLLIGVTDYVYQRYRFEQSLRMTKQELKEELKHQEGDPQVKGRMRQMARDRARQRMLAEVPRATVVITNPTHLAVALRYEPGGTMKAPRLLAKGATDLAGRIVERARAHGIPIIERPALARALFRSVALDQDIPTELFIAVAKVLAFVYELRSNEPRTK